MYVIITSVLPHYFVYIHLSTFRMGSIYKPKHFTLFSKFRGDGDYGKLGHGNAATQKSPKQILGPLVGKVVVQISAGYRHSAAVTSDGQLFTWGEGDFGRLGHGDSQFRFVPTLVKDILVGSVSCGAAHTLALSPDCKVAWYVVFQSSS